MRDHLLGTVQPVFEISLALGESVVAAEASGFAWMTDSIQVAVLGGDLPLCVYTAAGESGTVAFAPRLPGTVLGIDLGEPGRLIRQTAFLAGTPGLHLAADHDYGLPLWHLAGTGRAWVELAGDFVMHKLTAGQSLRVRPPSLGMCDPSIAIQLTQAHGCRPCAVLSGPGIVWLLTKDDP